MSDEKELREIDAWVAEHVMGWPLTETPDDFTADEEPKHFIKNGKCLVSSIYTVKYAPNETPFGQSWKKFSPTTNPADAMVVLERCVKRIEEISIDQDCLQIQWYDVQWNVCTFDGSIPVQKAETLPLAICRFAQQLFKE